MNQLIQAAIDSYAKAISIDPEPREAWDRLGDGFIYGRIVDDPSMELNVSPERMKARNDSRYYVFQRLRERMLQIAHEYREQGQFEFAAKTLERSIALDIEGFEHDISIPQLDEAFLLLSKVYFFTHF